MLFALAKPQDEKVLSLSLKDTKLGVGGVGWGGGMEGRGEGCEPVPNLSLGESAVHPPTRYPSWQAGLGGARMSRHSQPPHRQVLACNVNLF